MSAARTPPGRLARDPRLSSVDLLEALVDAVPTGILLVDSDGRVALANAGVTTQFGWEPSDLLGRPVEELIPRELRRAHHDYRDEYRSAPEARPMGHDRFLRGLRKDGSGFMVEVALSPMGIDGQTYTMAVTRDITSRVDAEELARRQEAWEAVVGERMRIARDLHDTVIQELFVAGLALSGLRGEDEGSYDGTIARVMDILDGSIRRLRETVFGLHSREGARDLPVLVKEAARILQFEPELRVIDEYEVELPDAMWSDIDKVIRECLANVSRHSGATSASVELRLTPDEVVVEVVDNGGGFASDSDFGTGLRSLRERAETWGGELVIGGADTGGGRVVWRVPTPVRR